MSMYVRFNQFIEIQIFIIRDFKENLKVQLPRKTSKNQKIFLQVRSDFNYSFQI